MRAEGPSSEDLLADQVLVQDPIQLNSADADGDEDEEGVIGAEDDQELEDA